MGLQIRRDALAVVLDGEPRAALLGRHRDGDVAAAILGRVVEQVLDHLLEPHRVGVDPGLGARDDDRGAIGNQRAIVAGGALGKVAQLERLLAQRQLAARYARHVEEIVHQAAQLAHLALDRRHSEARLAVLEFRAGEEIRRHGDRGERVAQLVREHGNELVLADIGLAQLADQRVQLGVEALALGDVARDLRGADDAALRIANRRDRKRDVDQPAILRAAHGLEVVHRLAIAHLGEHHVFLGAALFGNDERDVPANRVLGAVAEHALGAAVPGLDDAVEGLADDGVVGLLDDRGKTRLGLLGALLLGDVDEHVDSADHFSVGILDRRRIRHEVHARAVRPLGDRAHAAHRPPFAQRHRHRALIVRQGRAVGVIELPGDAPGIAPELRHAAREAHRLIVEAGDAAFGIGRVDRRGQRFQDGTHAAEPVEGLGGVLSHARHRERQIALEFHRWHSKAVASTIACHGPDYNDRRIATPHSVESADAAA